MKIIRRTVTAIAFIGLLMLTFSASAAPSTALEMEEALLANIEFEAMPTNSVPYGMTLNRVSGYVSQPDPSSRNKAGLFTKKAGSSCVDIPFNGGTAGSVIYQFDIMTGAKASYPEVSIRNTSGTGARLFTADANGSLTLPDGRKAADLRPDRWYKVAVRCSYTVGRYDLMIDGKTVANRVAIPNSANLGKPTILRIQLQGDVGSSLWVDNIRIYASDSVVDKDIFVHDVYNDTVYELPDDTVEQGGGSGLYLNADFEALEEGAAPSPFSINLKDTANSFAAVALPDEGGKGVRLEKKGSGDPYGDISIKDLDSERVFLEMRVMMENQSGIALIQSKDGKNSFNRLICFQGGRITVSGTSHTVGGYDAGDWIKIALALDYGAKNVDAVYINDEKVDENIPFDYAAFDMLSIIRVTFTSASPSGALDLDYIRLYSGSEPKTDDEIKEMLGEDADSSAPAEEFKLITPENEVRDTLNNAMAFVTTTGAVYADGEKQTDAAGAKEINNATYLPARLVLEQFGGEIEWDSSAQTATVRIGGNEAVYTENSSEALINGRTEALEHPMVVSDDCCMLPIDEIKDLVDAQISEDTHLGIVVLDGDKKGLTEAQVKDIYDMLTYSRPTAEQILSDYSAMKGKHPRIMATAETFERIRRQRQTNEKTEKWCQNVLRSADNIITQEHSRYEKPDGLRLLDVSRKVLSRSLSLGMAYQLTGDTKYADYLWDEYEAVGNFPDWNPGNHYLDTAEMTNAVAIGYDWLYDYWTAEQREFIENTIMKYGLQFGEAAYSGDGVGKSWIHVDTNWNAVCNGGMAVGALALMDVYPERCAAIIQNGLLSLESMLGEFAPDGAWIEGPTYWNYCINYYVYHMAAMNTALGTDYGYCEIPGLNNTCYYPAYNTSSQGTFNIGDGEPTRQTSPVTFFFGERLNDKKLTTLRLTEMEMYGTSGGERDLLFYDPDFVGEPDTGILDLDRYTRYVETATFRSAWGVDSALFAGIHGGDNSANHGNLDGGTFVLDALGERWAWDLGAEDYNLGGYFDDGVNGKRWNYYRCNTQGQNVLTLNPVFEKGQYPAAFLKISEYESKPKGGYAVVDMTDAYYGRASYARRGMLVDRESEQVVVQDELNLLAASDLWWFMHTKAHIDIESGGRSALLTQNGKQMYVALDCNDKNAKFIETEAKPLPNSPVISGQNANMEYTKLAINLPKAKGKLDISVRFIPLTGDEAMLDDIMSNGLPKITPISAWNIDDGELDGNIPQLSEITVDGEPLTDFRPDNTFYDIRLPFGAEHEPEVDAAADDRFNVEVIKRENGFGSADIKVTSIDDPDLVRYYGVNVTVLPLMGLPDGAKQIPIQTVTASDEPQPENNKENAIDGDLTTRWSASGKQWITADLGSVQDFDIITMAFYQGTTRVSYFTIEVSADGKTWSPVYQGTSSGVTDSYESYFVGPQKARYIRFTGTGNSAGVWNSYSELAVFAQ